MIQMGEGWSLFPTKVGAMMASGKDDEGVTFPLRPRTEKASVAPSFYLNEAHKTRLQPIKESDLT